MNLLWVGNNDPTDMRGQNLGHRRRIAGRLHDDDVVLLQPRGECLEAIAPQVNATQTAARLAAIASAKAR